MAVCRNIITVMLRKFFYKLLRTSVLKISRAVMRSWRHKEALNFGRAGAVTRCDSKSGAELFGSKLEIQHIFKNVANCNNKKLEEKKY
jgi:hypothetical protein